MDKDTDSLLTSSQFTLTLIGSMIGLGVLSLPFDVTKAAKQDGWISTILGSIYPFYIIFIANYMCKKFPKQNILTLSKRCFGKFLGTILNLIFISFFLMLSTEVSSGIGNVLRIYMMQYLINNRILLLIFLVPAFVTYKGIKTIGRINEMVFYLTLPLVFIPIAALKDGSLLNLMPVFGSGLIGIIKGTKETAFSYSGIEIVFLIYPYLQDSSQLKRCGIKSIIITMIIYTWVVFITIFYLGIDIIPKFLWPVVTVSEAIKIPLINNFRYIFMILWSVIMFKTISDDYYGCVYGLSEITKAATRKTFVLLMYPLFFYVSTKYGTPTTRSAALSKLVPAYTIFNLLYITIISLVLAMKKGDENEEQSKG
jgi:spore germination protein (amino acid permease)